MAKTWDYIGKRETVNDMPPYTTTAYDVECNEWRIVPDVASAQAELMVVSDLSDVNDYRGLFLHVNDHGNVTLYQSFKNGNVREVWSVV